MRPWWPQKGLAAGVHGVDRDKKHCIWTQKGNAADMGCAHGVDSCHDGERYMSAMNKEGPKYGLGLRRHRLMQGTAGDRRLEDVHFLHLPDDLLFVSCTHILDTLGQCTELGPHILTRIRSHSKASKTVHLCRPPANRCVSRLCELQIYDILILTLQRRLVGALVDGIRVVSDHHER